MRDYENPEGHQPDSQAVVGLEWADGASKERTFSTNEPRQEAHIGSGVCNGWIPEWRGEEEKNRPSAGASLHCTAVYVSEIK